MRPLVHALLGISRSGISRSDRQISLNCVNFPFYPTRFIPSGLTLFVRRAYGIVPGYGLAVAQAQHKIRELYDRLDAPRRGR